MPTAATIIAKLAADEAFQQHCLNNDFHQLADSWEEEIPECELSRAAVISQAAEQIIALNAYVSPEELNGQWNRLRENRKSDKARLQKLPARNSRVVKLFIGLAASALLAIGVFQFFAPTATLPVTITTTDGEMKAITLPDGSRVRLNANSQLQYADDWNSEGSERQVSLKGEGYFEVTKSSEPGRKKFTVLTELGQVRVLGTEFNLRQRSDEIELLLLEGKVSMSVDDQEDIIVLPGQYVRLDEYDRLVIDAINDQEPLVAWLNRRMVIRAEPINQIQQRLREEFSVDLIVPDPELQAKEVSATMSSNDPFALLEALAVLYDLDFEISRDSLQITLTE